VSTPFIRVRAIVDDHAAYMRLLESLTTRKTTSSGEAFSTAGAAMVGALGAAADVDGERRRRGSDGGGEVFF